MKKWVLLILVCGACAASIAAETRLGTVKALSGNVSIDAFGKGAFIPAVPGDIVYASTVLRTDADGKATIDLGGREIEVPPGATVRIADMAGAAAKKGALQWFAAVGKLIKSFADVSRRATDELALGSRAAEGATEASDTEWVVEETDPAVAIYNAREDIDAGRYSPALDKLGRAEVPKDPVLAWQLFFWKGFCSYQTEDYINAVTHLSAASTLGEGSNAAPIDRAMLRFLLGSSLYLVGRDKEAVPILDAFLAESADSPYAAYATVLLARALAGSGDPLRGRLLAAEGMKKYRGSDVETELAALSK